MVGNYLIICGHGKSKQKVQFMVLINHSIILYSLVSLRLVFTCMLFSGLIRAGPGIDVPLGAGTELNYDLWSVNP